MNPTNRVSETRPWERGLRNIHLESTAHSGKWSYWDGGIPWEECGERFKRGDSFKIAKWMCAGWWSTGLP